MIVPLPGAQGGGAQTGSSAGQPLSRPGSPSRPAGRASGGSSWLCPTMWTMKLPSEQAREPACAPWGDEGGGGEYQHLASLLLQSPASVLQPVMLHAECHRLAAQDMQRCDQRWVRPPARAELSCLEALLCRAQGAGRGLASPAEGCTVGRPPALALPPGRVRFPDRHV